MHNLTADPQGPIKKGKDSRCGPRESRVRMKTATTYGRQLGTEMRRTETDNVVTLPRGVLLSQQCALFHLPPLAHTQFPV